MASKVDEWSFEDATKYLTEHDINVDNLKSFDEMKQLIIAKMTELRTNDENSDCVAGRRPSSCDDVSESQQEKKAFLNRGEYAGTSASEIPFALEGMSVIESNRAEGDEDEWSYDEAESWLKEHNVNFDNLESLEEMTQLIKTKKAENMSDEINSDAISRKHLHSDVSESQRVMKAILEKDERMKRELSDIYNDLQRLVITKVDEESKTVLTSLYGDYITAISIHNTELINDECPIVVAGEVSAGKSSFLNLLLGEDVLPHSLLCATSTICCVHNDTQKRLHVEGDTIIDEVIQEGDGAIKDLQQKLKKYVSVSSDDNRDIHKYKRVDIYWPVPMLPPRVTIVDTPGVGESEAMTARLMHFLPKAVAFIYIINSSIAGGIQEDKLIRILKEQTKWELEGRLTSFDSESTIFVCNKWDIVKERGEEQKVWEYTVEKLKDIQPNISEDSIFKMSTSQAARYIRHGMGHTDMFKNMLTGLKRLMPRTLQAKVNRHYRWIDKFLSHLQSHVSSRINNARKSEEEKLKMKDEVLARVNKLRIESGKVSNEMLETARSRCLQLASQLFSYVTSKAVKTRLLDWSESDAPEIAVGDFEVTKLEAEKKVLARIQHILKEWEKGCDMMKSTSTDLANMFKEKCSLLDEQCKELDLMIEGDTDDNCFMSNAGAAKPSEQTVFSTKEKVILGVASPLWIPLVIAAGILFIPVGIGVVIADTFRAAQLRNKYKKNKVLFMKDWTEKLMELAFTKQNVELFIMQTYFQKYEEKINELCTDFIPKQIEADEKIVHFIVNDVRSSQQIVKAFTPLQQELRRIVWKFKTYKLHYVSEDLVDIDEVKIGERLGSGSFADVFKGNFRGNDVAVKVMRAPMNSDKMISQLEEIDSLRILQHPNVIKFLGVAYEKSNGSSRTLSKEQEENAEERFTQSWQKITKCHLRLLFELCDDTLRDRVFGKESLKCCTFKSMETREGAFRFFVCMVTDICNGLQYIHDQGFIHRDLKLSNVLIKNGHAQLCDMGSARLQVLATTTFAGTITHMSPEILTHQRYNSSTDIYSLGILLWEFWYATDAYLDIFADNGYLEAITLISGGHRPNLNRKYKMMLKLQKVVVACWHVDPVKRPPARDVAIALKDQYFDHYKKELPTGFDVPAPFNESD